MSMTQGSWRQPAFSGVLGCVSGWIPAQQLAETGTRVSSRPLAAVLMSYLAFALPSLQPGNSQSLSFCFNPKGSKRARGAEEWREDEELRVHDVL